MKLPLIPIKQPKEWLYFNRVQEIETQRDGENLKTGGWHPYTVKNTYLKNAKKNRRMLKYVKAKVSSRQRLQAEQAPTSGKDGYG